MSLAENQFSFDAVLSHKGIQVRGDDHAYLRSTVRSAPFAAKGFLSAVDFFSGCGGMSLGVAEGAAREGLAVRHVSAVDFEDSAHAVYRANFPEAQAVHADVGTLLGPMGSALTDYESGVLADAGRVDLLVGGPPCQGHSDLNNFTRRDDPKNRLILHMARAAEVFRPAVVLIENVQGALRDRTGDVEEAMSLLAGLGYQVQADLVDMTALGVPQTRRRCVIAATLVRVPPIERMLRPFMGATTDLRWAIGDLEDAISDRLVDKVAVTSGANRKRIDYLFDNDAYDLPNSERPACHRDKDQSYGSVYGRLRWDRPAQTITSGFYNTSMGRYVHPARRRTLTAREAARVQFFPDHFDFGAAGGRTALATMIGNAVPMKLTFSVVSALARAGAFAGRA